MTEEEADGAAALLDCSAEAGEDADAGLDGLSACVEEPPAEDFDVLSAAGLFRSELWPSESTDVYESEGSDTADCTAPPEHPASTMPSTAVKANIGKILTLLIFLNNMMTPRFDLYKILR